RRRNGQSQHQRRRIPSRMELHNLASLTQNLNVTRLFRGVALDAFCGDTAALDKTPMIRM
ncbi:MAG: hypothetical protein ACLP4V_02930, partial [Methylocella sp.]